MTEEFKLVSFDRGNQKDMDLSFLNLDTANKVRNYHANFPVYKETPLVQLKNTAAYLGLGNISIKDESYRFGLNAFKVLGGSFAIGNYIAKQMGMDISELPYAKMISNEVAEKLGKLTFITATDGNHGRGVAWTANQLKQKSVVYMPKGSATERLENIKAEGADASITELNYDDAVRKANKEAEENGWVMVQDTAWEGYEEIPTYIIQGYVTMGLEAYEKLPEKPTHIFVQAGVGSLACAMIGFFSNVYKEDRPIMTVVEPNKADCLYRTAAANDNKLHFVTGQMDTIMAGLACGEPCSIAWEVLKNYTDHFISCPDYVAAKGMRILGNPIEGDTRVISGESGAATMGALSEIMTNQKLNYIKEALKLDDSSRILLFSTEGDTDRENYREIVWDGKYPNLNNNS